MLFFLHSPWFPTLALLSRFVEEGWVVFGCSVELTFPWMLCPCGIHSLCQHCLWCLCRER